MMWPFTKQTSDTSNVEVIAKPTHHPRAFKTESRPYDRYALRKALINNRCERKTGAGPEYWDSVVDLIERHLNLHPLV